ncbi:MAG: hypothetical protein H0U74_13640 [Bradymonadaceae bacterium]|nr:hypothetical protein [Lujinxingiaceae bacterium]
MSQFDITIATCRPLPEPDPDEAPLLDALAQAGLRARLCAWHDRTVDWSLSPLTIIRSTWNYYHDRAGFVDWAERVTTVSELQNSASVVRWNSHKGYLLELARRGVRVVPSELIEAGQAASLEAICAAHNWSHVVVKPAVSAGSFETHTMRAGALDTTTFARLMAERDVLVQPYIDAVDTYGERSLIVIDGELSHSVRKHPRFAGQHEQISGPHPITPAERAFSRQVLASFDEALLYARVDLVPDVDGQPMLTELELIEPSLFFRFSPEALARLVGAIESRLRARLAFLAQ